MKKMIFISSSVLILFISFGFFYGQNSYDERTTTAVYFDASNVQPVFNSSGIDAVGLWTAGANVLQSRYAGSGASWTRNDTAWLFFICGDPDGSGQGIGRVDKYNINTNTWSAVAPSPLTLANMSATRLRDSVYTVGGLTTGFFTSSVATVQKYDINANTWTTRAPLPAPIGWPEAVAYQDSLIYCVGGLTAGGSNAGSQVYLYNATNNTWRTATSLPTVRVGGGCAISGDTIVYVGGNSGFFNTPDAVVYRGVISQSNRSTITWTTGLSFPGSNRWRFSCASWGCKGIIISGGAVTGFTIGAPQTYTYSPGANTWTAQANMTNPTNTSQVGSVRYSTGVWKYVMASGLILSAPYSIPNTQIYTDTLCPAPAGYYTEFCRTGLSIPLNDFSTAKDSVLVPPQGNGCTVLDVNYKITNLTHTYDGDVSMYAQHLTTGSKIVNRVGGSGANFINTVLNDSAATPIASGTAPFTGSFRPSNPLTPFNGQSPNGYWKLVLTDSASGDVGTLTGWCIQLTINCPVGGVQTLEIPNYYSLSQNYPNPFNPATVIKFTLPKSENVKLVVFDILGREVKTLVNEVRSSGVYEVNFDASALSSGVYFYRLETDNFTDTKRMLLVK